MSKEMRAVITGATTGFVTKVMARAMAGVAAGELTDLCAVVMILSFIEQWQTNKSIVVREIQGAYKEPCIYEGAMLSEATGVIAREIAEATWECSMKGAVAGDERV